MITNNHKGSQNINPTDHKWSTQQITNDQPNGSQKINLTDLKESTQWHHPWTPNGKAEEIKSKKINELNKSQENNEIKS